MTFDPFGDFESRGYLRNFGGLKDAAAIKEAEHLAFCLNLPDAVEHLRQIDRITYLDVLDTHKILFGDIYPWAGQDRATVASTLMVSKGEVQFAPPGHEELAVQHALRLAQEGNAMSKTPGVVIGYLSYGHPFLDGNGRTIIVVADELAYRAGISIDWASTDKQVYLGALTRELDDPRSGALDAYLGPHIREGISQEQATQTLARLPGLGPETKIDQAKQDHLDRLAELFGAEIEANRVIDHDHDHDYDHDHDHDHDFDHEPEL